MATAKSKPIKSWKPYAQTVRNTAGNLRGKRRGKNLVQGADGFIYNQYGVEFTAQEKKKLESMVNTANAKRRRMLKNEAQMQLFTGGEAQGVSVSDSFMGRESDFVVQAKTKSLQRFRTREDYENYVKNLERVNDRNYINVRVGQYKENYVKALESEGFDDKIVSAIKNMKTKDFMKLAQQEEYVRFGFIYDNAQRSNVERGIVSGIARITGKSVQDFDITEGQYL